MKKFKLLASTAISVALLAACGGGSETVQPTQPAQPTPVAAKAYVAGDSLTDVGVFGARFTVQSSNPATPYLVWPELVANGLSLGTLCPAYNATLAPVANCTGYGVGGAQINPVTLTRTSGLVTGASAGSDTSPFSIVQQITDMSQGRTFGAKDVIMIDGGGNDANALASSLLEGLNPMNPFAADALAAYRVVLKDLLPAATVDAVANTNLNGLAQLGGAYMQATARMLAGAVKTQLLTKGAERVVVLNLPDLSKAPVLNTLNNPTAFAIIDGWAKAMNAELVNELTADSNKVLIVDFYSILNGYVKSPNTAKVGNVSLSNATDKACGTTNITACVDTTLDTSGPVGWSTYLFADGLHSTPFGNQLLAQSVRNAINTKGWNN